MWLNKDPFDLQNFYLGLHYSISLLAILTAHEFGHYFAARYHKINSTLPFYIPMPPFLFNPFGTMGAIIKIKSPIPTRRALFDIGASGPVAGFVVTLIIFMFGVFTLPTIDYLYTIHPEYQLTGTIPQTGLAFGNSLFTWGTREFFSSSNFFPPMNEIYHYPFLCVGWFGLFITALNLIPIGQLDGGHILYALIGRKQGIFARIFFGSLIVIGLSSFIPLPYFSIHAGTVGWLVFALILYFLIKLDHPPINDDAELDPTRKLIGWITIVIFIFTFLPVPFYELIPT
jgi:membrane-associated protease RseP (regulator of RpoE activity)